MSESSTFQCEKCDNEIVSWRSVIYNNTTIKCDKCKAEFVVVFLPLNTIEEIKKIVFNGVAGTKIAKLLEKTLQELKEIKKQ